MKKGADPMSTEEVVRELERGFELDADVTVTELRTSAWMNHLEEKGKLRIRRHDNAIGVVMTPRLWEGVQTLAKRVQRLEEQLEEIEIQEKWGDRIEHERRPAPEAVPHIRERLEQRLSEVIESTES